MADTQDNNEVENTFRSGGVLIPRFLFIFCNPLTASS